MDILSEIDNAGFADAKSADLKKAYKERNQITLRNYADLLYMRILNDFYPRKDDILTQLEQLARTPGALMRVKMWDYCVTYRDAYHLPANVGEMIDFTERGYHTVVFDDGRPMSVDAIFRNTDLAWRLAFTFGSKFRVVYLRDEVRALSADYSSYRIGVYVQYYPKGLPEYFKTRMIDAYTKVRDRSLHLGKDSYVRGRF